jgi:hypothetical protein
MVPAFGGGERSCCFDAKPITPRCNDSLPASARQRVVADDVELTCTHSPNCYANAGYRDHDRRCSGDLRLDIPTHRRESNAIWVGSAFRARSRRRAALEVVPELVLQYFGRRLPEASCT